MVHLLLEQVVFGWCTSTPTRFNVIQYITISSTGDAQDFGDTCLNQKVVVLDFLVKQEEYFVEGSQPSNSDKIEYITIASLGDAQDFGTLSVATSYLDGGVVQVLLEGMFFGGNSNGNTIGYITITTTGNAQDFGDVTTTSLRYTRMVLAQTQLEV